MRIRLSLACLVAAAACGVPAVTELDAPPPSPDGGADAPVAAAHLVIAPAAPTDFGDVVLGATSSPATFTVTNDGDAATAALTVALDDAAAGFAVGDDTCAGHPLAGHASCTVDVGFAPTVAGAATTALRIDAAGDAVSAELRGRGLVQGTLDIDVADHDFGAVAVDAAPAVFVFTVHNTGQATTGAPVATITGTTDSYAVDATTCDHPLAAGDQCTVAVRFDPITVGSKPASLGITAAPGGPDTATLGGVGTAHVLVAKVGTGAGVVASNQPGIDCGTACEADFTSSPITLVATPELGSTFNGWSDDCAGLGSCSLGLTGGKRATALFRAITPTLTVVRSGAGTVTSSPAGIDCGVACASDFAFATAVTLTATAATGTSFTGWSGACAGAAATCTVTMDLARTVTATFTPITPPLTVTTTGPGTVTSSPAGIACGASCTASFGFATTVTLTAAPDVGASFTGWSGACTGTGTCTVVMDQARDVTATFAAITPTLTVAVTGAGSGAVRSSPAGIDCGATCSHAYPWSTAVTLTATPQAGSVFAGWTGACTGTGPCVVTMDATRGVGARFDELVPVLTVIRGGTGTGTVTSTPAGIACGATCTASFAYNTAVTLTAVAATGSTWSGWSVAACGTAATCTVTMDAARTVTATFDGLTPTLTVTVDGTGDGAVVSNPVGISCGSACSAAYPYGTGVTLTAAASTGSTFTGWSGACAGTSATCVVAVDRARAVTATFTAITPTLTVVRSGNGGGAVTSTPAGIACGATCGHDYAYGTAVTLTATADAGDSFTGWSGDCAGAAATCTVTMTQARTVTAQFTAGPRALTVTRAGAGTGTVTSSPAGISCGATCTASVAFGTTVTLTATATGGSAFLGWSGACATSGTCTVTMDAARAVTATFGPPVPITIALAGTGTGTVASSPAGLDCPGTCATTFPTGTTVVLTATPTGGATFGGWSGVAGCTTSTTCIVTAAAAATITATFAAGPQTLHVDTTGGDGVGVVRSTPVGIDCGVDCTQSFAYGTSISLTATPGAGHTFTGWSGPCTGTGTCVVTMTQARTVVAAFMAPRTLTVAVAGTGRGTVTSSPSGVSCTAGTCSASFAYRAAVTVTAAAGAGDSFRGWSGPGSGQCASPTAATCTVTLDASTSLVATFDAGPQVLTVTRAGAGGGTVASTPAGLACPGTCAASFAYGTTVTVTATSDASSSFAGWSGLDAGACADPAAQTCTVTLTQARSLTATFAANPRVLSVVPSGTGTGTITSVPTGITCPGTCALGFAYNTTVTLTATPTGGSSFAGWSGTGAGGCTTAPVCTVTMDQPRDLVATFAAGPQALTVTVVGTGTVTSTPGGVACPGTCAASFAYNTAVTLAASAPAGWTFAGWSNGCTGTAGCVVTMDRARAVTATFTAITPPLTVAVTGGGTVGASPAGTPPLGACGGTCTASYAYGAVVTLTATPSTGWSFSAWGGACSGSGSCTVTMDAARSVSATFVAIRPPLSVTRSSAGTGTGTGTVTASDGSINCGATCTSTYAFGATVTLTATPDAGSNFSGWGGACSGTGTCVVTMDQARAVSATFSLPQTLTVATASAPAGYNLGTVSAVGINCPGSCSSNYPWGTVVVLTANPGAAATFAGWSLPACGSNTTCAVTMTAAAAITATFAGRPQVLTVAKNGSGSVTGGGIDCGATCSASVAFGAATTVTATAAAGWSFAGWVGCDSTSGAACTVVPTAARTVTASFTINSYPLTVTNVAEDSLGTGIVTASSGGLSCGSACTASYPYGTSVTLTATPSATGLFAGWGGACAGTASTCTVTVDQARAVTASFVRRSYTLTVEHPLGTVTSTPAGINCTATATSDCTESYPRGTDVSLVFAPRIPLSVCGVGSPPIITAVDWLGCDQDPADAYRCTAHLTADTAVSMVLTIDCP